MCTFSQKKASLINFLCPLTCILFPPCSFENQHYNPSQLHSSHIAKQIQHGKLACNQFESQKQRKISRPLTSGSGPAACRSHRAGEPGGIRQSHRRLPPLRPPGSGALACGAPRERGLGFRSKEVGRNSALLAGAAPRGHVTMGGAEQTPEAAESYSL